jgi:hypothetical protein
MKVVSNLGNEYTLVKINRDDKDDSIQAYHHCDVKKEDLLKVNDAWKEDRAWTYNIAEDVVLSGCHRVDRDGYFITLEPWAELYEELNLF